MFKKAERKKAKLRLALMGPSGSGKTYSALRIAQGLGGSIAMIDTEAGSGELYANLTDYDVCPLSPPFTPEKFMGAIKDAEESGYNVLIIDSLSHAWAGEGGILDMHDTAAKSTRSGNSYTAWREVTPAHNRLVEAILQSKCHIIVCMRTKTAYDLVDDGNGKKKPVKIGLAPVQRDGLEYEFTAVFDLSIEGHVATASKDRTSLYDGKHFVPTEKTGEGLLGWLNSGEEVKPVEYITREDWADIEKKLNDNDLKSGALCKHLGVARPGEIEKGKLGDIDKWIEANKKKAA